MKEAIRHGYVCGGGLRCPSKKNFFLGIPKNASTFLSNTLVASGWQHHILGNDSDTIEHVMVVLKDPVERWISGVGTYITSWILGPGYGSDHFVRDYNNLVERFLFETLILDDHTTPQVAFVKQLDYKLPGVPVTYFKLDRYVVENLGACISKELSSIPVDANVSEDHYDQQVITNFIKNRLYSDFTLRAKVVNRFYEDYELINKTQFYYEPR